MKNTNNWVKLLTIWTVFVNTNKTSEATVIHIFERNEMVLCDLMGLFGATRDVSPTVV